MKSEVKAKWVLVATCLGSIVALLFAMQIDPAFSIAGKGPWGDFVNGITSPILLLSASILTYLTIREQIEANKMVNQRIEDEGKEKRNDALIGYINIQVNQIKSELSGLEYKKTSGDVYRGYKALYEYSKDFQQNWGNDGAQDRYILDRVYYHQSAYGLALNSALKIGEFNSEWKLARERHIDNILLAYTCDLSKFVRTILEKVPQKNHILSAIEKQSAAFDAYLHDPKVGNNRMV
jgi:hypothetical protein